MGFVEKLFRYPVKSLGGEELEMVFIRVDGVEGDRRFALVDEETGLAVSAKNPKLYSKLLDVKAFLRDGGLFIQTPDGNVYKDDECGPALSALTGRRLKLINNDGISLGYVGLEVEFSDVVKYFEKQGFTRQQTFHDSQPIHIVFGEALSRLGLDQSEAARFRPNILVDSSATERDVLNKVLEVGDALLKIVKPTKRCVMVTLPQKDLKHDITILKTIRERFNGVLGLYAQVVREGVVRKGDPIKFYPAETLQP